MRKFLCISLLILASGSLCFANDPGLRESGTLVKQKPGTAIQCGEIAEDCYAKSNSKKTNCFFSAAKHPFCEGTKLGDFLFQRWAKESSANGGTASAFLGSSVVDKDCLNRLDSQVSSEILRGAVNNKSIELHLKSLNSCSKRIDDQLTRP